MEFCPSQVTTYLIGHLDDIRVTLWVNKQLLAYRQPVINSKELIYLELLHHGLFNPIAEKVIDCVIRVSVYVRSEWITMYEVTYTSSSSATCATVRWWECHCGWLSLAALLFLFLNVSVLAFGRLTFTRNARWRQTFHLLATRQLRNVTWVWGFVRWKRCRQLFGARIFTSPHLMVPLFCRRSFRRAHSRFA